jgi:hypothetical protein
MIYKLRVFDKTTKIGTHIGPLPLMRPNIHQNGLEILGVILVENRPAYTIEYHHLHHFWV